MYPYKCLFPQNNPPLIKSLIFWSDSTPHYLSFKDESFFKCTSQIPLLFDKERLHRKINKNGNQEIYEYILQENKWMVNKLELREPSNPPSQK